MRVLNGLVDRVRTANPFVVDALIAIVFASLAVVEMQELAGSEAGFRDNDSVGVLLVLAQTLPLGLRRVAPIGSLAVMTVAVGLYAALGHDHPSAGRTPPWQRSPARPTSPTTVGRWLPRS